MVNERAIINVSVVFRNVEPTDALKSYAVQKVEHCLKKYVNSETEVHLVLTVERHAQIAEISFRSRGHDFRAEEKDTDLYVAIDRLVSRIEVQLRKQKDKATDHKNQQAPDLI